MNKTMELTAIEVAVINLMRKGARVELDLYPAQSGGTNQNARQALDQLSNATGLPVRKVDHAYWTLGHVLDDVKAVAFIN